MLRISKLTDYAVALSAHLARCQLGLRGALATAAPRPADGGEAPAPHQNVRALSDATQIPVPTVRKVLKILAKTGMVHSIRGTNGGYGLARPAGEISVAELIVALEGPIGVTECTSEATAGNCELEGRCTVQGPWQHISRVIRTALAELTLADMAEQAPAANASHTAHAAPVPIRLHRDRSPDPDLPSFVESIS